MNRLSEKTLRLFNFSDKSNMILKLFAISGLIVHFISADELKADPFASSQTVMVSLQSTSNISLVGGDSDGDTVYFLLPSNDEHPSATAARGRLIDSRVEDGQAYNFTVASGSSGRGILKGGGYVYNDMNDGAQAIQINTNDGASGFTFEGWIYPRSEDPPNH